MLLYAWKQASPRITRFAAGHHGSLTRRIAWARSLHMTHEQTIGPDPDPESNGYGRFPAAIIGNVY